MMNWLVRNVLLLVLLVSFAVNGTAQSLDLDPPFGQIEEPTSGSVVTGMVHVSGWMIDAESPTLVTEFLVDGQVVASSPDSTEPRLDVCAAFPTIGHCSTVEPGLIFEWDTRVVDDGLHTVEIRATDLAGLSHSAAAELIVSNDLDGMTLDCLIFVHGSREKDVDRGYGFDWSSDWSAGRRTWREDSGLSGEPLELDDAEDFIRASTNDYSRPYYVVRYNGAAPYWSDEGAGLVATQIRDALKGEYDFGGTNRCGDPGGPADYWVVTHSSGAQIMDFILGNASADDPFPKTTCTVDEVGNPMECSQDAPFDEVAAGISGVISIAGAHRGSALADIVCDPQTPFEVGIGAQVGVCTDARRWLQTGDLFQVANYSGSPAKPVFLIGGYRGNFVTGGILAGHDDGVLSYASVFACAGDPAASYMNADVCGIGSKQEAMNFFNVDAVNENHSDIRNNKEGTRERRAIPDGMRPGLPDTLLDADLSTAELINLVLSEYRGASVSSP